MFTSQETGTTTILGRYTKSFTLVSSLTILLFPLPLKASPFTRLLWSTILPRSSISIGTLRTIKSVKTTPKSVGDTYLCFGLTDNKEDTGSIFIPFSSKLVPETIL